VRCHSLATLAWLFFPLAALIYSNILSLYMKINETQSTKTSIYQYTLAQDTATRLRSVRIFETIRERIGLLIYPPGIALRERELAEEFGVSRTPIRAVLHRLEFEGLTFSRQGHGTIVTDIDLPHLKEIYQIRMKLSEMFGESTTLDNATDVLQKLDGLIVGCNNLSNSLNNSLDLETFARINMGFHAALQGLISNKTLRMQIDTLFYQTVRMWSLILTAEDWAYQAKQMKNEIQETKRFLEAGDLESMGYIRRIHLSLVIRRLNELFIGDLK
jgi:DNA-binding GntR family transcriptional regulator